MRYRYTLARIAAAVGLVGSGTALVAIGAAPAGAANSAPTDQLSSNFALAVGPSAQLAALSEPGCHLGNGVQHVFYVGFDNFHLRRDNSNTVANNGDDNHNTDRNTPATSSRCRRSTTSCAARERRGNGYAAEHHLRGVTGHQPSHAADLAHLGRLHVGLQRRIRRPERHRHGPEQPRGVQRRPPTRHRRRTR